MSVTMQTHAPETIDDAVIESWCARELFFWQAERLSFSAVSKELRRRHDSQPMQFLYHIRDGRVSLADKDAATPDKVPVWRPPLYLKFLNEVVSEYCADLETDVLLHVGDGGVTRESVPIFAFQKHVGANAILMPDVDFLEMDFYESQRDLLDEAEYNSKSCSAVFAGSTTGKKITKTMIQERQLPRLRSALFFKDEPSVDFRLPVITRDTPDDAKAALWELGFGRGDRLSYPDQFGHKFIISLDGFGATCSRLPIVLRSNSALLKYDSPHLLYYFPGMMPWLHYIPIPSDGDVNRIIQIESRWPGTFERIAREGKEFANKFLVRPQVMKYTACLLRAYAESLVGCERHRRLAGDLGECSTTRSRENGPQNCWKVESPFEILVHFSFRGDVSFEAGEWAGVERPDSHVEGFALQLGEGMNESEIQYRAISADASLTPICHGGDFCGSRGNKMALTGYAIRTAGTLSNECEFEYWGTFSDGARVGPCRQGELCQSEGGAALRSLSIQIIPRPDCNSTPLASPTGFFEIEHNLSPEQTSPELFMKFESLGGTGHGCEFGLVQRHFGSEPLGLLRWADISFECLASALESQFEGVGDEQYTEVFSGDHMEYWTRDKRFHMAMRTFVKITETSLERMTERVCMRLKFLRSKLISDLGTSEKIFVYRNMFRNLESAELLRLHATVGSYGNSILLYLCYADAEHLPGSVHWVKPGLMIGHMQRFAFSPENEKIGPSEELFLDVCRTAAAMVEQIRS